jgi:hypothetical protein
MKLVKIISLAAIVLAVVTGNALAVKQVDKTLTIPAEYSATILTSNCLGAPGPQVMIQSEINPVGLEAEIIFSQPGKADQFMAGQEVVPQNVPIPLTQQSVVGGLGDNPFLWLQITDARGKALTSEIFLGQCSQGSFSPTAVVNVPVEATAEVSASGCEAADPTVTLNNSQVEFAAINGRLILRNSTDTHGGPGQTGEVELELVLLPTGQVYAFPQPVVQGTISPNPQISLQFREGGGSPVGNQINLGRCSTLSN